MNLQSCGSLLYRLYHGDYSRMMSELEQLVSVGKGFSRRVRKIHALEAISTR